MTYEDLEMPRPILSEADLQDRLTRIEGLIEGLIEKVVERGAKEDSHHPLFDKKMEEIQSIVGAENKEELMGIAIAVLGNIVIALRDRPHLKLAFVEYVPCKEHQGKCPQSYVTRDFLHIPWLQELVAHTMDVNKGH